jgi:hypothetical protein
MDQLLRGSKGKDILNPTVDLVLDILDANETSWNVGTISQIVMNVSSSGSTLST